MKSDLERFCEKQGIRAEATFGANRKPCGWKETDARFDGWRVTLRRGRAQLSVDFFTGSAVCRDPTAADVLSCLLSDSSSGELSFGEFCSEFGYDEDSRTAEATWKACRKMSERLPRFLGELYENARNCSH